MSVFSLGAPPASADAVPNCPLVLARIPPAAAVPSGPRGTPAARLQSAWEKLISSDATLFGVLLVLNAWALPYSGLVHDARLYGIQVVNRVEGGSFGGDLYLRFGSQDRFTLFSVVAAPLVDTFGLQLAFLIIYLVSNALFLFGSMRLVLGVCGDRLLASLGLILLATTHIPFAGLENFYVNESFVTPRLAANGLVLWGLARLLEGKKWSALLLLVTAASLHPLMACGGLLVWAAYQLTPRSWILGGLAGLAAAGALFWSDDLAGRLLGRMDSTWREAVRRANPYNFPTEWAGTDWGHLAVALGIACAACSAAVPDPARRRLIRSIAAVAGAGIAINLIACELPYALPIQGQGYRWLWLLQYLEAPLGLLLVRAWWLQGTPLPRSAAVVLAAYLGALVSDRSGFLALLPCVAVAAFYLTAAPGSAGRRIAAIACAVAAVWLIGFQIYALHSYWVKVGPGIDVAEFVRTAPTVLLAGVRLCLAVGIVLALGLLCTTPRRLAWTAALLAVVLQAGYFSLSWAAEIRRPMPGLALAREYFQAHDLAAGRNVTIYWPVDWINHIWFDLHADSYFEPMQIAGNIFNRDNALEGQRRIQLVQRFELGRVRELQRFYSPLQLEHVERLFQASLTEPAPTEADVLKLCAQENLDFLLLRQGFAPWYVATDGNWFLYDCRAVRARQVARPTIPTLTPTAGRDAP